MPHPNEVFLPPPGRNYAEAITNIADAIARERGQIAPRINIDGRRDWNNGEVPPNLRLVEYVLVSQWQDLDSGTMFVEVDTDQRLRSHTIGLLTMALDFKRR